MPVLLPRHSLKTFTSPVNSGTGLIDANIVRTNDNLTGVTFNAHDADTSIHVQSGVLASRPATATEGSMYVGTDTALIYLYTGGAWITIGDTGQTGRRWGAFQDFTDQSHTAINTAKLITFDTIDTAYGVTIDAGLTNSKITVNQAGVYNFQWSGQFTNADTQIHRRHAGVPARHGGPPVHRVCYLHYSQGLTMPKRKAVFWRKDNPLPKKDRTTLTPDQKAKAKARAKAAGRPYPNLVDSVAAMKGGK